MIEGTSAWEARLAGIPAQLHSIFLPQLRQFDAQPIDIPFGLAARIDDAVASGWFWACAVGEDCLVTTMYLVTRRDFLLQENPAVDYYVLGLLSNYDSGIVDDLCATSAGAPQNMEPFEGTSFESAQSNARAFSMHSGLREVELPAGSLHDSRNICMLPSFAERMGHCLDAKALGLHEAFVRGVDLSASTQLRQALLEIGPADASRAGAPLHYQAQVIEALAEMVSYLHEGKDTRKRVDLKAHERVSDAVRKALLSSLASPPSIDELSERLYLGRTRLCQRFRDETGMSIGEMLTQLRVSEAKRRLEQSDESVGEIARALGFAHASSFTTMFTRQAGMSPSAWRKRQGHS